MTVREFLFWAAFVFKLEPRGDARNDWHIAMLLAQQVDIHRDHRKSSRPRIADYLPRFAEKEGKSVEEMRQMMRDRVVRQGGKLAGGLEE